MYRRRECEGWGSFYFWRWVTGGLVVGLVVLMLGVGWHLMVTPAPSAEEQQLALRQEQADMQAHQQEVQQERAAAAADERLDATWRPWRTAAWNVLQITLALAPVVGLVVGGAVLWGRLRAPGGARSSGVRGMVASMRGWLRWRPRRMGRPERMSSTWHRAVPVEPRDGSAE
jgi:hypothetical protein